MTITSGMFDDESNDQLRHRRISLLRAACPNCDRGQIWEDCTCNAALQEVDRIEDELTRRGVEVIK